MVTLGAVVAIYVALLWLALAFVRGACRTPTPMIRRHR